MTQDDKGDVKESLTTRTGDVRPSLGAAFCSRCPFCGGGGKVVALPVRSGDHLPFMAMECQACGARGPVSTGIDHARAIRKWNERHTNTGPHPIPGVGCDMNTLSMRDVWKLL
jgi:Lar family restriction alleviation protein